MRRANKGTQRYDDGQEPKRFHVAGKNYSSDELLQPLPARALYDCLADGHNGLPLSLSLCPFGQQCVIDQVASRQNPSYSRCSRQICAYAAEEGASRKRRTQHNKSLAIGHVCSPQQHISRERAEPVAAGS